MIAAPGKRSVREIWLIEDNIAYRRSLARAIDRIMGFSCTGQYGSFEEARAAFQPCRKPDLILLDLGLPGMNGVHALRHIRALCPESKVIILTVFEDFDKISQAARFGSSGYLLKTAKLV